MENPGIREKIQKNVIFEPNRFIKNKMYEELEKSAHSSYINQKDSKLISRYIAMF